jgi:hypothetical protein
MAAIPAKFFSKILEQVTHNAARMFRQLSNLPHPVHIVPLSDLETFSQFSF